jgi:hypothetical protein
MTSNNACKYNSFVSYLMVNTTMAKKKRCGFVLYLMVKMLVNTTICYKLSVTTCKIELQN